MNHITAYVFIKRLSKRAKLDIAQTQLLVKVMHEQITKDLIEGKRVRLKGIGIIHRVNYANLPDRDAKGNKLIHVHPEQFHVYFAAASRLKHLMQKAYNTTSVTVGKATPRKLRPHEIARLEALQKVPINIISKPAQTPVPPPTVSKSDNQNGPVKISHVQSPADGVEAAPAPAAPGTEEEIPIRILVKPKFPTLSWRVDPEHHYVSVGLNRNSPGQRMLQTLLRQLGRKWNAVTITPKSIIVTGPAGNEPVPVSDAGLQQILEAIKELGFDIAKRHYQTKIRLGAGTLKTVDLTSGFTHDAMPFARFERQIISAAEPVNIRRSPLAQLITDAAGHKRRVVIVSNKQAQPAILAMIEKILTDMDINYHRVGSDNTADIAIGQHLKHLADNTFYHPVTLIQNLSGADDWFYLQNIPSGVIALAPFATKDDIDRIVELQKLPSNPFHTVVRSIIMPLSCPDCRPEMASAVQYPALRRIAGQRNELLHVHPIRVNQSCSHPKKFIQLFEEYAGNQLVGPLLADQLYDLLLKHEIDWPAYEANTKP